MDFELPEDTLMLRDMLRRFIHKEAQPLEMKYFTAGFLASEERAPLATGSRTDGSVGAYCSGGLWRRRA